MTKFFEVRINKDTPASYTAIGLQRLIGTMTKGERLELVRTG